jgi:hypothetical protein
MVNYLLGIAIALDQLVNALIGGDPDEMISARAHEESKKGSKFWIKARKVIDKLFFWQINHSENAYEYERKKVIERYKSYFPTEQK